MILEALLLFVLISRTIYSCMVRVLLGARAGSPLDAVENPMQILEQTLPGSWLYEVRVHLVPLALSVSHR